MKSQVLHTVWCNITGEAAGGIWTRSTVKGSIGRCVDGYVLSPQFCLGQELKFRSPRNKVRLEAIFFFWNRHRIHFHSRQKANKPLCRTANIPHDTGLLLYLVSTGLPTQYSFLQTLFAEVVTRGPRVATRPGFSFSNLKPSMLCDLSTNQSNKFDNLLEEWNPD